MRIEVIASGQLTQEYLDLLQSYELETTEDKDYYIVINSLEELFELAMKIRKLKSTNDELIITYSDYRKKDDIVLEIYNDYRE